MVRHCFPSMKAESSSWIPQEPSALAYGFALDNGSVLRFRLVDNGDRFIFPKDWLETYIISNLYELILELAIVTALSLPSLTQSTMTAAVKDGLTHLQIAVSTLMWVETLDTNVSSFQYNDWRSKTEATLIMGSSAPSM